MATSPTSPTESNPPSAVPLPLAPPPPPTTSSRRLPPPCWSPEETAALIDAYRDKWYSLGRGNLKATHWQEVADAVTARCPAASAAASQPKTPVQCRHKMEKLRKRYRTEIQRARSLPVARFNSSWIHFKPMDSMEKGPSPPKPEIDAEIDGDDDDDDDGEGLYREFKNGSQYNLSKINKLYPIGIGIGSGGGGGGGGGGSGREGGFRIRIPSGVSIAKPGSKFYGKVGGDQKQNPYNPNYPNLGSGNGSHGHRSVKEGSGIEKRERERDPIGEMVSAIKVLGDGFVRMEQMKMEMAREIETMRMEMEMKRTEMILESQQRIVEAFAKAVSEQKKKAKRIPSPSES